MNGELWSECECDLCSVCQSMMIFFRKAEKRSKGPKDTLQQTCCVLSILRRGEDKGEGVLDTIHGVGLVKERVPVLAIGI